MTNLEKRDLSQNQAFEIYPKIEQAWERGDFEECKKLNNIYESLVKNANYWEQKEINS